MIRRSSEPLRALLILADLTAAALAWLLADALRLRTGLVPILAPDYPPFALCVGQLPLLLILAIVSFRIAGMYDVSRLRRFREDIHGVLKGVALLSLSIAAITFAMQSPYRPRGVLALFPVLAALGILLARRITWAFIGRLRSRGINQSRAIIVARPPATSAAALGWASTFSATSTIHPTPGPGSHRLWARWLR
jgi:FlaA1/EpsC-like NDP-sugar epimerase